MLTNPDVLYADTYELPRMSGQMPFYLSLKAIMENTYSITPELIEYGKPTKATYEYGKEIVDKMAAERNLEISNYYMIGDNPRADIAGPNRMGPNWRSILVRSGIYKQGHKLSGDFVPTYEVENMHEAVQLILKEESLE